MVEGFTFTENYCTLIAIKNVNIHKQEKNNHGLQKKPKKNVNSKFSNKKIV